MIVKIVPVSDLRQQLKDLLAELEETGEPYFITQYSRAKAVLLRYEDYNALVARGTEAHPRIARVPGIGGGEPIIRGTRIAVREIAERTLGGESVEEILAAFPHLTAAQVHDALSYYYDHQAEVDQLIEESKPERVLAAQRLIASAVAPGVAVVHDASGKW